MSDFEALVESATVGPFVLLRLPTCSLMRKHQVEPRWLLPSSVLQKVLREALTSAVPPAEATAAAVAKIFPGAVTPSQVSAHAR